MNNTTPITFVWLYFQHFLKIQTYFIKILKTQLCKCKGNVLFINLYFFYIQKERVVVISFIKFQVSSTKNLSINKKFQQLKIFSIPEYNG